MSLLNIFTDYGYLTIIALVAFAFIAGFIDAVVGGGGLIQVPAMLINLPTTPLPTILGTSKIAAFAGTSIAAIQYSKQVKFNYKVLLVIAACAGLAAFAGAQIVSHINTKALKPLILVILIVIAIYTFFKKDLGAAQTKQLSLNKQMVFGALIGLTVGFYDGFFGPGTGSFLVLGFVVVLGFSFVQASAYAKVINSLTNFAALIVFISQGNYIIGLALLMLVSNVAGNIIGAKLALKKGNSFVRVIFLVIVLLMIIRYSYDVFIK